MAELEKPPVAVTIIGGFLGAGKTTLLERLLKNAAGARIGVLVNDFGEISIDAELIAEVSGGVLRLTNGCICCTIRGELTRTLFRLIETHPLDAVVIETSGLSDPRAVAQTFRELDHLRVVRLDGLISVVDLARFADTVREHAALARAQVEAADLIVLNKLDQVTPDAVTAVEAQLSAWAPNARRITAIEGDVPLDLLLGIEAEPKSLPHDHALHSLRSEYRSWTFREDRPLAMKRLAPLLVGLPPAILRVKGFANLIERPGDRILIQVAGARLYVRTVEPWGARPIGTELVLIGRADANYEPIEAAFRGTAE